MQPRRPHGQWAPPRLTTMWPISPAPPRPSHGLPSRISPPPTPVPQNTPEHRLVRLAGAERELGLGRDLDVVADHDLGAELLRQRLAELERAVPVGEVAGVGDRAGLLVDVTRRARPRPRPARRSRRPPPWPRPAAPAAMCAATSAGPPSVGVGWRDWPSTSLLGVDDDRLDLGPPRSIPPRSCAVGVPKPSIRAVSLAQTSRPRTPGSAPARRWARRSPPRAPRASAARPRGRSPP